MTDGAHPSADPGEQPLTVVPIAMLEQVPVVAQLVSKRLPHVPRLSILFLMAWTGVTAVILGWIQWTTHDFGRFAIAALPFILLAICLIAAAGWQICGTALVVWHLVRRTLWRLEPGEWLSLVQTNLLAWWFAAIFLQSFIYQGFMSTPQSVVVGIAIPCIVVGGLVVAAIAFRRQRVLFAALAAAALVLAWCSTYFVNYASSFTLGNWQGTLFRWMLELGVPTELSLLLLFAALGVRRQAVWCAMFIECQIIVAVANYSYHFDFVRPVWHCLLVVGLMIAGMIVDRRQHVPRHWLHWSGLLTGGVSIILLLGLSVVRFMF